MRVFTCFSLAILVPALAVRAEPASTSAEVVSEAVAVETSALAALTWIQGEAPSAWEPGKVYLLDLWSTTCPPCVRGIPRMNDLHLRFGSKGLRVFGVSVQNEDLAKVEAFVKSRGEGMAYPVAYEGTGGEFGKNWLRPGDGIPRVFVIKDGRRLLDEHPLVFTDEVIEALLAGGEAGARVVAQLGQARDAYRYYYEAYRVTNIALMTERLAEFERAHPDYYYLPSMRSQVFGRRLDELVRRGRYAEIAPLLRSQPEGLDQIGMFYDAVERLASGSAASQAGIQPIWRVVAEVLADKLVRERDLPGVAYVKLAEIWARAGEWEEALAAIRTGEARFHAGSKAWGSAALFTQYRMALEARRIPTDDEVNAWAQLASSG